MCDEWVLNCNAQLTVSTVTQLWYCSVQIIIIIKYIYYLVLYGWPIKVN